MRAPRGGGRWLARVALVGVGALTAVVTVGAVVVAGNLGAGTWTCPVDPAAELLAASDPRVGRTASGVSLPPDTVAIVLDTRPGKDR